MPSIDNDYQHGSGSNIALVTETPNEYPTSYSPTTIATTIPHHELDSITNEGSSNIGIISRRSTTRSRGSTSATYDQPPATPRLGIGRVGTLSSLMKPKKPVGPAPSMFQSFRSVLTSSCAYILVFMLLEFTSRLLQGSTCCYCAYQSPYVGCSSSVAQL